MQHALKLPAEARADLAASLIESLDDSAPDAGVEEAWAVEIERRLAEVDSGAVKPIPWHVARARIEAATRRAPTR